MGPLRAARELVVLAALLAACGGGDDASPAHPDAGGGPDAGARFGGGDNPTSIITKDAGETRDRVPPEDAFFINDPAPPVCGPGGQKSEPKPVSGTPDCPDDKNRQGCPCPKVGEKAACWPGKRINRNHGICEDGTTVCRDTSEFGRAWGPCEKYVLPEEGAETGPAACRCFSGGKWVLNNLVPCIYTDGTRTFVYSSHPSTNKSFECNPVTTSPPAKPPEAWNKSTLNADCAGQFKLCYTIKAGLASKPQAKDCVLTRSCVDIWYETQGKDQTLPELPGWIANDAACSKQFVEAGGYGEMSVQGVSEECDLVDDGRDQPYVFRRTSYCSARCVDTPTTPECMACAAGGSGQF